MSTMSESTHPLSQTVTRLARKSVVDTASLHTLCFGVSKALSLPSHSALTPRCAAARDAFAQPTEAVRRVRLRVSMTCRRLQGQEGTEPGLRDVLTPARSSAHPVTAHRMRVAKEKHEVYVVRVLFQPNVRS